MTLEQLRPLIQTPPQLTGGMWGFGTRWSNTVIKKHARRAWAGQAYVATDDIWGELRIWGNGTSAPYAVSFEDLLADDWESVD